MKSRYALLMLTFGNTTEAKCEQGIYHFIGLPVLSAMSRLPGYKNTLKDNANIFSMNNSVYPLTKLPPPVDLILYLIREELKTQYFFAMLEKAGIDDVWLKPHLGKVILMHMGMDDGSDEVYHIYYRIIEKRCKKIGTDNDSIMKQVMKVYNELLNEKAKGKVNENKVPLKHYK